MSSRATFDHIQDSLQRFVDERGADFEAKYGKNTRVFLDAMPDSFYVARRVAFDLGVGAEPRRLAALAVVYVCERHDFRMDNVDGVDGLIDDLWVLNTALLRIRGLIDDAHLRRHFRPPSKMDEALSLAENSDVLTPLVASKILESLQQYLRA